MPGKINKVRSLTVLGFHLRDSDFKVSARRACVYPGGLREVILAREGVAASPRRAGDCVPAFRAGRCHVVLGLHSNTGHITCSCPLSL